MQDEWLKADYYDAFLCKGGDCRNSCCEGWQIPVPMEDYFRLIGTECSAELHHRLECAFRVPETPSPERFRLISPNWLGVCPLHAENGLCMLQVECGPAALTEVCRVYPRSLKREAGFQQACCSNSCEAVIEILMRENMLRFEKGFLDAVPEYAEEPDPQRLQLGLECLHRIENTDSALRDRIRAACAYLCGGDFAPETDAPSALKMLVDALEGMRGDFTSLDRFGAAAFERYAAEDAYARYEADAAAMEAAFPQWEMWFTNILINHFFYMDIPCVDARLKEKDVCAGLCATYAGMRVLSAAYLASEGMTKENFADVLAGFFRMVEHSAFYYNMRVLMDDAAALTQL